MSDMAVLAILFAFFAVSVLITVGLEKLQEK